MIKYASPRKYFAQYEAEFREVYNRVLLSDNYILGNEVEEFEKEFASAMGTAYCVGVNSGTDALTLSLIAAGISEGDEVITTALTAPATVIAIINAGAVPVVVDVSPPTYCIDVQAVEAAINNNTKAVIPVHLHGYSCDLDAITELCQAHDLVLIEDCAQATGAQHKERKVGTFGDVAAFSFYPTKNLACPGDGGAVITNTKEIAEQLRTLRFYGFNIDGRIHRTGFNTRLSELHAGFLRVLLHHLEKRNEQRENYALKYAEELESFGDFLPPIVDGAVYHQFPLRVPKREKFISALREAGLVVGIHYPYTIKQHPALSRFCGHIPVAEKVSSEFVSIPIQPEVLKLEFDKIVNLIKQCLKNQ